MRAAHVQHLLLATFHLLLRHARAASRRALAHPGVYPLTRPLFASLADVHDGSAPISGPDTHLAFEAMRHPLERAVILIGGVARKSTDSDARIEAIEVEMHLRLALARVERSAEILAGRYMADHDDGSDIARNAVIAADLEAA